MHQSQRCATKPRFRPLQGAVSEFPGHRVRPSCSSHSPRSEQKAKVRASVLEIQKPQPREAENTLNAQRPRRRQPRAHAGAPATSYGLVTLDTARDLTRPSFVGKTRAVISTSQGW